MWIGDARINSAAGKIVSIEPIGITESWAAAIRTAVPLSWLWAGGNVMIASTPAMPEPPPCGDAAQQTRGKLQWLVLAMVRTGWVVEQ